MSEFGFACIGTSHPHTLGRVEAMSALGGRLRGLADDDPSAAALARFLDARESTAAELLADPEVDAVLVHSWTEEMLGICTAALRAGKAVLVEKPCGTGPDDIARLAEVVEQTDGILQAGFNFRHSPVVDFTQRVLEEGLIGDVVVAHSHGSVAVGEHRTPLTNQPDDIGGSLYVIGCHMIDILVHHFGFPRTVTATVPKFEHLSGADSREDAAAALFGYEKMIATYDFTALDPLENVEAWRLEIFGTAGMLRTSYLPSAYELYLHEPTAGMPAGWTRWEQTNFPTPWSGEQTSFSPDVPAVLNTEFFALEAERFIAAMRGVEAVTIDARHAADIARLIGTCYASSEAGSASLGFASA